MSTARSSRATPGAITGVVALWGGEFGARAIAFIGTTYLARVLGPEALGIVGLGLALAGYLGLAIRAGLDAVGAQEVAEHPDEAADIAASVIGVRIVVAAVSFGLLAAVAHLLPFGETTRSVVILTGLCYFTMAADTSWVQKGLSRTRPAGIASVLTELPYVAIAFLAVSGPADVELVPVSTFLGQLTAAVYLGVATFRVGVGKVDLARGWRLFRTAIPMIGSRVLRTMLISFDVVLLGLWCGERLVGLYSAPYRICFLLMALSAAAMFAYLPEFAAAQRDKSRGVNDVLSRSVEFSFAVALPTVVGGVLVARPLLEFVFGAPYGEGAAAFELLLVSTGFILFRVPMHNVFLVRRALRLEMAIMAAAVVLNVGLNVWLIPSYDIVGAAGATLAAEFAALAAGMVVMYRWGLRVSGARFVRVLVAAAAMAAVVVAVRDSVPVLAAVAAGVVTYGAVLALVGGVPRDVHTYVAGLRRDRS